MNPKQLEPGSSYAQYDTDGDGVVSDEEIATSERLQQLEIQNEKLTLKGICVGLHSGECFYTHHWY